MRKWSLVLLLTLIFFTPRYARAGPKVTLGVDYRSNYVGENGAVWFDTPVLQTDLYLYLPKNFYLDIWHSTGLDDFRPASNGADELNYLAGWKGTLFETGIDLGVMYIDLLKFFRFPRDDIIISFLDIEREIAAYGNHSFRLGARTEVPFGKRLVVPKNGLWLSERLKYIYQFSRYGEISNEVQALYDSGLYGFREALIGKYSFKVSWNLFGVAILNAPSITVFTPITSPDDPRTTQVIYGVGIFFEY